MPRPGYSAEQRAAEKAKAVRDALPELRQGLPKGKPFQLLCDTIEDLQAEVEALRELLKFRGV